MHFFYFSIALVPVMKDSHCTSTSGRYREIMMRRLLQRSISRASRTISMPRSPETESWSNENNGSFGRLSLWYLPILSLYGFPRLLERAWHLDLLSTLDNENGNSKPATTFSQNSPSLSAGNMCSSVHVQPHNLSRVLSSSLDCCGTDPVGRQHVRHCAAGGHGG